jgi:hypothetical protein
VGFWAENDGGEIRAVGGTLYFGLIIRVGSLEKCLEVGKITKIYMKLTKSGGIAR